MVELKEILESWEKDCQIQEDKLDLESLNIPRLHHKYLKLLSEERLNFKKVELNKRKNAFLSHVV